MSEENVEIVRAVYEALNSGEMNALLKDETADFEFDFSRSIGPQAGVFRRDEVAGFAREFLDVWEASRWEVEEFIEAGEQVVASISTYHRGRDGIEVQARGGWVWTLRDGKIARLDFYQSRAEALEAAGLSE